MRDKLVAMTMSAMILLTAIPVMAGEFPQGGAPGNDEPQIYLIKKIFDICNPACDEYRQEVCVGPPLCRRMEEEQCKKAIRCEWRVRSLTPGEIFGTGGQTPYGDQTIQYAGCIDTVDETRFNQYAFTGEQILELVVVRDLNGAEDIVGADVIVDGIEEAKCDDVTSVFCDSDETGTWCFKKKWFRHDVENLLETIPPSKGPADEEGIDMRFDKIYECILTVEPSWYGMSVMNIEARDQSGSVSTDGIAQTWFWNPAVILDLDTNDGAEAIWYEDGVPGQTVYSGNKLVITNLAEGGVDLLVFLAADDLTDPSSFAAKCPVSNVLDVDGQGDNDGMEYRCKIGTMADNEWYNIQNKNTKMGCSYGIPFPIYANIPYPFNCYGATPVIRENLPILMNQHEAECQFRLTYPIPCIGNFSEGLIHLMVRAI
jgi:hypothetical protein